MSVIVVNAQSIMAKKESFRQILDSHNPDIILMSKTWLKPDMYDAEVIPPDVNYELFRNDKTDGHGGFLIAIKRNLIYELVTRESNCEFIAVKVSCAHNSLIVAAL